MPFLKVVIDPAFLNILLPPSTAQQHNMNAFNMLIPAEQAIVAAEVYNMFPYRYALRKAKEENPSDVERCKRKFEEVRAAASARTKRFGKKFEFKFREAIDARTRMMLKKDLLSIAKIGAEAAKKEAAEAAKSDVDVWIPRIHDAIAEFANFVRPETEGSDKLPSSVTPFAQRDDWDERWSLEELGLILPPRSPQTFVGSPTIEGQANEEELSGPDLNPNQATTSQLGHRRDNSSDQGAGVSDEGPREEEAEGSSKEETEISDRNEEDAEWVTDDELAR